MSDINLRIGAKDDGAMALLRRILAELQKQNTAVAKSNRVSKQARDEKGRFIKVTEQSRAALKREAQTQRELAAAQLQSARETARALQQRTQAGIAALRSDQQRLQVEAQANRERAAASAQQHRVEQAAIRVKQQADREATQATRDQTRAQLAALRVSQQRAMEQARADRLTAAAALQSARAQQAAAQIQVQAARNAGIEQRAQARAAAQAGQVAAQQARAQMQAANNAARAARQQTQATMQQARLTQQAALAQQRAQMQAQRLAYRSTRDIQNQTAALGEFTRRVVAYAAALGGIRLFTGFIREGLRFNEILESSRLGIASIITATSDVHDPVSGRLADGAHALNLALSAATDQVNKLRIAGLQTAATTEELVQAYQSAVAAGTAAGLNLDEIRGVTVQIVQAAGAIGLPMQQLEQEVRSILDATIDRNSRVARVLGITNEQVRLAKEQNRLADYLNDRLESFSTAGERAMNTFRVMRSNLQEAMQVFAGEATQPLFDRLTAAGQKALVGIFDFDQARIANVFAGLVGGFQEAFGKLGDFLASGIGRAIRGLEDLSAWLNINRVMVGTTIDAFFQMAGAVGEVVLSIAGMLTSLIQAGVESGNLAAIFDVVRQAAEAMSGTPIITVVTLALIGQGVQMVLKLAAALKTARVAQQGLNAAMLLNPYTAAAVGIVALAAGLSYWIAKTGEARREAERMGQEHVETAQHLGRTASSAAGLAVQYEQLMERLSGLKEGSDEYREAEIQLLSIRSKLVELNPDVFQGLLNEEDGRYRNAEAIWEEIRALRAKMGLQLRDAAQRYNTAAAEKAALEEQERVRGKRTIAERLDSRKGAGGYGRHLGGIINAKKQVAALDATMRKAVEEITTLDREMRAFDEAMQQAELARIRGRVRDPDPSKTKGAHNRLMNDLKQLAEAEVQRIRAQLAALESELKRQLEAHQLSYAEYYTQLTVAQQSAARRTIEVYTALQRRITDKGEQAKIGADIEQITAEALTGARQNAHDMSEAYREMQKEISGARLDLLDAEGKTAQAAIERLRLQFRDLIDRLKAEGEAGTEGLSIVERLFDVRQAQVLMAQVEEMVATVRNRLQGELGMIEARVITGVTREWDARQQVVVAYRNHLQALRDLRDQELRTAISGVEGSKAAKDAVEALNQEIVQTQIALQEATDAANELFTKSKEAFRSDLTDWLSEGISGAESLADAFRALAESVVSSIRRIVAEMISSRITEMLFGLFKMGVSFAGAGAGGGFNLNTTGPSGPLFAASGGHITGRGTGSSDSIPAMLSNGEYVLRASAVRALGVDTLDEINFGRRVPAIRRRRFAEGGLAVADSGGGHGMDNRLQVGLEDGLVLRHIEGREGQRAVLKVLEKNRTSVRRALGLS